MAAIIPTPCKGCHVSELQPPKNLLFIPQTIYNFGQSWLNDMQRGKPKNLEEYLSQCHLVHHKSHMD